MELVPANWERILDALVPAWTKRCEKLLTKGERDFCFVWDAKVDGLRGAGVFCRSTSGTNICTIRVEGTTLTQWELRAGLVVRF